MKSIGRGDIIVIIPSLFPVSLTHATESVGEISSVVVS